jgi:alpha-L-fucosidase
MNRAGFSLGFLALLSCASHHPLEGKNVFKRREAATMLGEDPQLALEAVPLLLHALNDDDAQVRWRAEFALGRLGAEGVPRMVEALRGPDRWAAAYVLGPMARHARRALPDLLPAATDDNPWVRVWAINAIGDIDPSSPALQAAKTDSNPDVRRVASLDRTPHVSSIRFPDVTVALVLHWGLFSVPHRARPGERAERVQENDQIPTGEYERIYGPGFTASKFDPDEWIRVAKEAGARALVVTAKGRDGFCLWDSKSTEFNAALSSQAKRDVLQELAAACTRSGMNLGIVYSIVDGHHEHYANDFPLYVDWMHRNVEELVTRFPVWGIWFDSEGAPPPREWRADDLAARVRRVRPKAIVDTWPTRRSFGLSRGYSESPDPLMSGERMIEELVETVSRGGSLFLEVGPKATGMIPEPLDERLALLGGWLHRNREAVIDADPSPLGTPLPEGPVTARGNRLYVFLKDPLPASLRLPRLANRIVKASVVDGGTPLRVEENSVVLPGQPLDVPYTVIALDLDGPPRLR